MLSKGLLENEPLKVIFLPLLPFETLKFRNEYYCYIANLIHQEFLYSKKSGSSQTEGVQLSTVCNYWYWL